MTFYFSETFIHTFFGDSLPFPLGPDQAYLDSPARQAIATKVFQEVHAHFYNWSVESDGSNDEVASGLYGGVINIQRRDYELAPQRDINFITFACVIREDSTFFRLSTIDDYILQRRLLRKASEKTSKTKPPLFSNPFWHYK